MRDALLVCYSPGGSPGREIIDLEIGMTSTTVLILRPRPLDENY
jgi:hypothetical protein